nr:hypothetical protein [Tanacetum cinerariifolium]
VVVTAKWGCGGWCVRRRVRVVCSAEGVVEMMTGVMLVRSDDGVGACRWGDAGGGVGYDVAVVPRRGEDVMAMVDLWCGDRGWVEMVADEQRLARAGAR